MVCNADRTSKIFNEESYLSWVAAIYLIILQQMGIVSGFLGVSRSYKCRRNFDSRLKAQAGTLKISLGALL